MNSRKMKERSKKLMKLRSLNFSLRVIYVASKISYLFVPLKTSGKLLFKTEPLNTEKGLFNSTIVSSDDTKNKRKKEIGKGIFI